MVDGIIEPASELQDIALIIALLLCFILILLAVWFACHRSVSPALLSMTGAAFMALIIWAMKGVFKK